MDLNLRPNPTASELMFSWGFYRAHSSFATHVRIYIIHIDAAESGPHLESKMFDLLDTRQMFDHKAPNLLCSKPEHLCKTVHLCDASGTYRHDTQKRRDCETADMFSGRMPRKRKIVISNCRVAKSSTYKNKYEANLSGHKRTWLGRGKSATKATAMKSRHPHL